MARGSEMFGDMFHYGAVVEEFVVLGDEVKARVQRARGGSSPSAIFEPCQ